MLSNTCKYAIRAAIYLAVHTEDGGKIGIKKISQDLELPTPFLGKILQTLSRHKILSSTKGPNGGFGLGRDAKDIDLMEIIMLTDGMDNFDKCGIGVKNCMEQEKICSVHAKYSALREEMKVIFQTTSLGDLVSEVKNNGKTIFI